MNTPLLSIIIPVYNVKDYLENCVQSIVCAPEFTEKAELILVDDGSTDGSEKICDMFAQQLVGIRVIHQENSGVSAARNKGIQTAQGRYLQFVDSDDWLEPNAFKRLIPLISHNEPDVVLINAVNYLEGVEKGRTKWSSNWLHNGPDSFYKKLISEYETTSTGWTAVVKSEFLHEHNIQFIEGIIHEDMEWIPHLVSEAESIAILEEPVYGYRLSRPGSIMYKKNAVRHVEGLLLAARTLVGESDDLPAARRGFMLRAAGLCIMNAMKYAIDENDFYAKTIEKEIKSDVLLSTCLWHMPKRYTLYCLPGMRLAAGAKKL